jgi:hypothetical protein
VRGGYRAGIDDVKSANGKRLGRVGRQTPRRKLLIPHPTNRIFTTTGRKEQKGMFSFRDERRGMG